MANQTAQLARLLSDDGNAVTLVRTNAPYHPANIAHVPIVRAIFRLVPYLARLWRAAGRTDVAHVVANSGWAWHLFAVPAVWIAWVRGVPVVVNYRGGEAASFLRRAAPVVRFTLQRASSLCVPSGFLQRVFAHHGIRSEVVPNVVDLSRFKPRTRESDNLNAPRIVVTRHLEAIYDVATAVRAFERLRRRWPQATLTVAGDGAERRSLEQLASDLGLGRSVQFMGNVPPEQIVLLYAGADLMLNASRVDNMPNAILEAMASAVPIVTTAAGGIPFVVDHERTALMVAPGDHEAMADAAERVLADAELRRRLRCNALDEVRRYTWDGVRPLLYACYASGRGCPAAAENES
jgi:glycosyltransferase involved in cell wall biosynthesis